MLILPTRDGQTYHPTSTALEEAAKIWLSERRSAGVGVLDEADIAFDAAICAEFPEYAGNLESFYPSRSKSENGESVLSVRVTDTDGDHFFVTATI